VQDIGSRPDKRTAASSIQGALGSKYQFGAQRKFVGGVRVTVYSRDEFTDLKSLQSLTTDQPWEAEGGMIAAPLRIMADQSSSGYIAQVDGDSGGYAEFDVTVAENGMYQIAARARADETESDSLDVDSLDVILDGQGPTNLLVGDLSGWSWVSGPVYELSAGVHRIELAFRDADVEFDKLALNSLSSLTPDQRWEAEDGVINAPLRIMADQSSNGYIAQVDSVGGGYAVYSVATAKDGKYQLKGKVKSTDAMSDTLEIILDGQEPTNWVIDHHSEWSWTSGPVYELSAGVHRIELAFRDADVQVDRLEFKAR
jgi:hypothetical protein